MNILLLTNHLNIGGITRYVLNLGYGLEQRGHNIFVGALPGWGEAFLKENNIYFIRLPLKTKSIFSPQIILSYLVLKKFIKKHRIELIHAQTRITQFLASRLSKRLNLAYVCTFHGFYRPHLIRRIIPCLGDLTIAISQAVGRHLIDDFNLNEENLRVVYNSIETEPAISINKDYDFLRGEPTLGIIARLSAEKGHLVLFSAFKKLIHDYPKARLVVVGSGKKEKELKSWVKKEKLNNQIIFLGKVADLSLLFKIFDVSILPSTIEGLGFSILEAQASGVPVVASRVGGITEIIKDRETGILVEPDNPDELYRGIKLILKDSPLLERIVNNAKRQLRERFNLKDMVNQVESIYSELLNQNRANAKS